MAEGIALDDYVKETLLSIVKAVIAAQSDAECGGYVGRAAYGGSNGAVDESRNTVTNVAFDLATTVEGKGSAGGSVGVKVIPFVKADAQASTSSSQSTVSRIAFTVPIAIPRPSAQKAEDQERAEKRRQDALREEREFEEASERLNGSAWMAR